ncbi:hypothetical protein GGR51DRAFT_507586 [Nemania sp. FL0031]|nr:hypothetical protein GGR51DRAFT_507586 [Nemania sp. FL0031]
MACTNEHKPSFQYKLNPSQLDSEEQRWWDAYNPNFNASLQADINTILHGRNAGTPATLIVATFRLVDFTPEQHPSRVQISIRFQDKEARPLKDPEVVSIWPEGDFVLSTTEGAGTSLGLDGVHKTGTWTGLPPGSRSEEGHTYLVGANRLEGRNFGKKNAVRLGLFRNGSQGTGLVTELKTAILLNRRDDTRFSVHIAVNATVDYLSSSKGSTEIEIHGGSPVRYPILFDPKWPSVQSPKAAPVDLDNLDTAFVGLGKALSTTDLVIPKEVTKGETAQVKTATPTGPNEAPVESLGARIPVDLDDPNVAVVAPGKILSVVNRKPPEEATKNEGEWVVVDRN